MVFASASALLDDCRPYSKNAYLIPHGVDWEHFAAAACSPQRCPPDVADLRGPVIGFFGLIHEWIDPRSGMPVTGRSASAIRGKWAAGAAGLAAAAFILGDEIAAVLDGNLDVDWLVIHEDGRRAHGPELPVRWLE